MSEQEKPSLFVIAIQGHNDQGWSSFQSDFYIGNDLFEAQDKAQQRFLSKYPTYTRNIAYSSFALKDGTPLGNVNGSYYQLRLEQQGPANERGGVR